MKSDKMKCLALGVIFLGAFLGCVFLGELIAEGHISFKNLLDIEKSANVGSFIAGTVGVLWSLGAVLLYYSAVSIQRKTYDFQKFESLFYNNLRLLLDFFDRKTKRRSETNGYVVEWALDQFKDQNYDSKKVKLFLNNSYNYRSVIKLLFRGIFSQLKKQDRRIYSDIIIANLTNVQRDSLAFQSVFDHELRELLIACDCSFSRERINNEYLVKNIDDRLLRE